MKTLTDIQAELQQLRNQVSNQIGLLTQDIEKLKPKSTDSLQKTYKDIMKLASRYPIYNKELIEASDIIKRYYLYYLAIIVDKESNEAIEQLLFISRIACGIQCEIGIQEILKNVMSLKEEVLNESLEMLKDFKYCLLLDMFIISNMMGCASTEKLTQIVDFAVLTGCDEEDIRTLSILASAILQNSLAEFSKIANIPSKKWCGNLLHIIPKEWIISYRSYCGITNNHDSEVEAQLYFFEQKLMIEQAHTGDLVKKGDILFESKIKMGDTIHTVKSIQALQDGLVFMREVACKNGCTYEENETEIYVVSSFDDYNDFCQWLEK